MRVFLSHSTADREFAIRLAEALRADRFDPWLYELNAPVGGNWVADMERGLRDADLVLLLWSRHTAA
jgi:hypothetical protein